MKLTNPTDDQLNEAFAVEAARLVKYVDSFGLPRWGPPDLPAAFNLLSLPHHPPPFTTSADAVLPWLEKHRFEATYWNGWRIRIICWEEKGENMFADDKSLPRAAVIALLRANGVEIEFTKATP